ncbi:hypothetical protein [Methanobacterium petrolearium]|uniref:hypothetical protein n=1 Tax=Methanobacterium petrolearium TaxID=710190 RepID=UPI001AE5D26A|nr:hypothetical protein [Methanobacterium petrolearium]MBP1945132.1 hypothetical protein [Methanobacterium petrolearium]BDZ71059.1 hypothetical protein GCM10025861_15760 [Methanobacterium petrolearium]
MKLSSIILIVILVVGGIYLFANYSQHSTLGSNQQGYVTKDVYSHYGTPNAKIAVVTGMHPREDLATNLVPHVVKIFALLNKVEIVDYHVTVTDQPQDFDVGRENGQDLVAQYVIPDIETTDYELVIIAHDHESGYGEDYYIATPTHDSKSVTLGEAVSQLLPQFNYYPGSSTRRTQSSSISQVDRPLANAGYPVFVYEIPEWNNQLEAAINTYQLFSASFNVLQVSN